MPPEKDWYSSKNSNVNRHRPFADERHLEGYEQGEAINAFLELEATDNDYLAILTELTGFACGEDSIQYQLMQLAMGIPDKKMPSVDDFKDCNKRQVKLRAEQRLHRFLRKESLEAAD